MKLRHYPLIAVVLASSAAFAGPKPSTSAPFLPEIAYAYYMRSSSEVRISNREGTAAVLLFRGGAGQVNHIDMAPRSRQMVAFIVDDPAVQYGQRLQLQGWDDIAGKINLESPRILMSGVGLFELDFSPDGNSIAFGVSDGTDTYKLRIANVDTGAVREIATLSGAPWRLTWSGDGAYLFYHDEKQVNGVAQDTIYRVASTGGVPEVIGVERNIEHLDTARQTPAGGSTGLLLSVWRPELGEIFPIGRWDGTSRDGAGRPELIFDGPRGLESHYSCDNRSYIYREQGRTDVKVTKIYDIAARVSRTFSTDGNIRRLDWNNCA